MTGLLHRLAARANGTAWTVRSDARLPFGADHLLPEGGAAQDVQGVKNPAAAATATAGMEAPMETAPPALQRTKTRSPAVPATAAAVPPRPSLPQHPVQTLDPQPATPPVLLASVPAQAAPANALAVGSAAEAKETARAAPAQAAATTHSALQTPAVRHSDWNTVSDNAVQPNADPHWQRNDPAPLLPPVRADASPSGMGTPQQLSALRAMGAAQQNPSSQDTEVHIHIGRIDVTAVHEKPQPKPRTRERTQPVSLDAYLAARSTK